MHLGYKTSRYKNKMYKYYFLNESYREAKKVRKRQICKLGKLTQLQARQIRRILKVTSDPQIVLTSLDDIKIQNIKTFGDIAVANALWEEWNISQAFKYNQTNSQLSTEIVARVLTLNRCISPCSHYSIAQWVAQTAVSEITGFNLENLNDDKIYYELDKIDQNQEFIEQHLFNMTYRKDKKSYDYVNYDLSSSYFVGLKCKLSNYGKSKDDKPNHKQVLLGILVNDQGYPFKWDVYPGNMAEVNTLIENVDACKRRFKLKNVTIVFDRGIVSQKNLDYIAAEGLKFISALDKDQIPNLEGLDLSILTKVNAQPDNYRQILVDNGFEQYDDSLFIKDLGEINKRRYVLGFNPVLFKEERECRLEKIACFEKFLANKNNELKNAKRSRKRESTRECILNEMSRLKIKKFFEKPGLRKLTIKKEKKKGQKGQKGQPGIVIINSFSVTVRKKKDIISHWEKLDGLCVFVSNHTEVEKKNDHFLLPTNKIITAYREKTKIEDAFKHIKSFLKIRPFFVNTDEHVRAVYTISVLAYFINKDLAERRKRIEGIDYLNSKNLYVPFKKFYYGTVKDRESGKTKSEPMEFTPEIEDYISRLSIKSLM